MIKICIDGGSFLALGLPEFPADIAQRLETEFPNTKVALIQDKSLREVEFTDTDILFTIDFSARSFQLAKKLAWLHLASAGAGHVLFSELIDSDIVVTNSRGLHAIPISEHILGVMIILARKLHEAYRLQLQGKWQREELLKHYSAFSELYGHTAGIIGLGGIGTAVAERVKAMGMRVIANKRTVGKPPPFVDELLGPDQLPHLLRESDYIIITTPLTPETKGLIGEKELRMMKPTSYIINVGRGPVIQEDALIRALREGWIAGAGLDVTEVEPLPEDSELFSLPNVFITPHYSGVRSDYWQHATEVFKSNLALFLQGKQLENVVDKKGGY
jgi:phosphoglycerate dehydrogenase-like enzyme